MTHMHSNLATNLPDFAWQSVAAANVLWFSLFFFCESDFTHKNDFFSVHFISKFLSLNLQEVQPKKHLMSIFFWTERRSLTRSNITLVKWNKYTAIIWCSFLPTYLHSTHGITPYEHSMVQPKQDLSSQMNFINLI